MVISGASGVQSMVRQLSQDTTESLGSGAGERGMGSSRQAISARMCMYTTDMYRHIINYNQMYNLYQFISFIFISYKPIRYLHMYSLVSYGGSRFWLNFFRPPG